MESDNGHMKEKPGDIGVEIEENIELDELSLNDENCNDGQSKRSLSNRWIHKYSGNRKKYVLTGAYIASFVMLGWVAGQFGPTFLDLQIIAHTTLEKGSTFLTIWRAGYLLGSLGTGCIFDKPSVDHNLLMFVSMLGQGVVMAIIPWCYNYEAMLFTHALKGLFGGAIDTCANAKLVVTWGSDANPYLQTLHFGLAVGGIISPLVTSPFLTPLMDKTDNSDVKSNQTSNETLTLNIFNGVNISLTKSIFSFKLNTSFDQIYERDVKSTVYIPHTITAFLSSLVALPFLIIFLYSRSTHFKNKSSGVTCEKMVTRNYADKNKPGILSIIGLVTMLLYMFIYMAVERNSLDFLATFVVKGQGWTKSSASYVTSAMWASFALGRLIGIFLSRHLSPVRLIGIYSFLLFLSFLGFLIVAVTKVVIGTWMFAIMGGFAMSVLFPTVLSWTEQQFIKVTGKVASAFLVSASSGTIVNALLFGFLMDDFTAMWFCYLLTGETMFLFTLFMFAVLISKHLD